MSKNLILNIKKICKEKYGNYVIQYLLQLGNQNFNRKIVLALIDELVVLSKLKFSSNVIEKCLNFSDENTVNIILQYMIKPNIICEMMYDNYGNYVLQKALAVAKGDLRFSLFKVLYKIQSNN